MTDFKLTIDQNRKYLLHTHTHTPVIKTLQLHYWITCTRESSIQTVTVLVLAFWTQKLVTV